MSRRPALERDDVSLDAFGVLRRDGVWVALPHMEREVMTLLLANIDEVVSSDEFYRTVWPNKERTATRRPLNVLVWRLRRRIAPLGLAIITIRGRGFLLHRTGPVSTSPDQSSGPEGSTRR